MKTMRLLTAGLKAAQLDWALAVALGNRPSLSFKREVVVSSIMGWQRLDHTDPALCLGFIKEHVFSMECAGGVWRVFPHVGFAQCGQTLEQAVARCVCLMHFGEWVDIPMELCSMDVL